MITTARSEDDQAARLLERLLTDEQLRARFRREPGAVAREAGLDDLAGDFSGSAMQTLEARESRSSLAGVMMAAALEGITGLGLGHHAAASGGGLSPEVKHVLARHRDDPALAASAHSAAADLATPEGAAANQAAVQPQGTWSSGKPGDAGVFPVVDHHASAQAGADNVETDDGGDDGAGDEADENEPDEDEGGDAQDVADETTHDQDSDPENPNAAPAPSAAAPSAGAPSAAAPADDSDLSDGAAPIDETDGGGGGAAGAYPGNDAQPGDIAAWMAGEARSRGLPPELPVMASLTESGMHNLDHGDRDSVGFFQMRAGVWDNGKYAGYRDKPELQLQWFLDKALEVKQQRLAAGKPVDDPNQYGDWIADVERPAEQYRGRYQLHHDAAAALLAKPADPAPVVDAVAAGDGARSGTQAVAAVTEAQHYLGTPYRWGGSSPKTGFDCSGLVQWAYAKVGVRIPRTTELQFAATNGERVARSDLVRGDVVFFRDPGGDIHHEGIYLGDGKFLHAPHTGDVVKVSSLNESYYAQQFAGGRRFAGAAPAAAASSSAPSVPDRSVRAAMSAASRDAAEARRPGTLLFEAVRVQEERKAAVSYPDGA